MSKIKIENPEHWEEVKALFAKVNKLIESGCRLMIDSDIYTTPKCSIHFYRHDSEYDEGFGVPIGQLKNRWFSDAIVLRPGESNLLDLI